MARESRAEGPNPPPPVQIVSTARPFFPLAPLAPIARHTGGLLEVRTGRAARGASRSLLVRRVLYLLSVPPPFFLAFFFPIASSFAFPPPSHFLSLCHSSFHPRPFTTFPRTILHITSVSFRNFIIIHHRSCITLSSLRAIIAFHGRPYGCLVFLSPPSWSFPCVLLQPISFPSSCVFFPRLRDPPLFILSGSSSFYRPPATTP
jgi:hypothetical protein